MKTSFLNHAFFNHHELYNLDLISTNNVFFAWFSKFNNFRTIHDNILASSNNQWLIINQAEIDKSNDWDYSGKINHYIELILEFEDNYHSTFANYSSNIFLWYLDSIDDNTIIDIFFNHLLPLKKIINLSSVSWSNSNIFNKLIDYAKNNNYYIWDINTFQIIDNIVKFDNVNVSLQNPNDLIYNVNP